VKAQREEAHSYDRPQPDLLKKSFQVICNRRWSWTWASCVPGRSLGLFVSVAVPPTLLLPGMVELNINLLLILGAVSNSLRSNILPRETCTGFLNPCVHLTT
jgi:hypothetical protein